MHLGDDIEGTKRIPIFNNRPTEPVLIVGKDRSTETLARLFLQEISDGNGATYFGEADTVLPHISPERRPILFELDFQFPRSFNPLESVPEEERSEIAESIVEAFAAAYPSDIPTPQLDNNLLAASLAMLSIQNGTLYAAEHLFTSPAYRKQVIGHLKDRSLKKLWENFDSLEPKEQRQQAQSVLNRLLPLATDPLYRGILGQTKSFPLRDTDVLIVDLPKGRKATLLAALIMSRLTGKVFIEHPHVFVGRGQPIIACRYLDQLPEKLLTELVATATILSFRLGVNDTKVLSPEFNLLPGNFSLSELPSDMFYIRQEETKLARVPLFEIPTYHHTRRTRNRSRKEYSVERQYVEKKLDDFLEHMGG